MSAPTLERCCVDLTQPWYHVYVASNLMWSTQHKDEADHEAMCYRRKYGHKWDVRIKTVAPQYEGVAAEAWRAGKDIRLPDPRFREPPPKERP